MSFRMKNGVFAFCIFGSIAGMQLSAHAADTTAPIISDIRVSNITSNRVYVSWKTHEPSNSQVAYGLTTSLSSNVYDGSRVTSHGLSLTGLTANSTYYYVVRSRDGSQNINRSTILRFTTASSVTSIPTASTTNFMIYMAPNGNDASDGSSSSKPILTLARAQEILNIERPAKNVQIVVAPGTYYNQKTLWRYSHPSYSIQIAPPAGSTAKPIFNGCTQSNSCQGGTWFLFMGRSGSASNIHISNLRIQNYWMAVDFNGDWLSKGNYNANNSVKNCMFYRIGNVFNSNVSYSYAAIRLVNSRNNDISNNQFLDVINLTKASYIHAVYAASYASGNTINYNTFRNVSGDTIRMRDYSNNNTMKGNNFQRAGAYADYSEWYSLSGEKLECPSWNNYFISNTYGTGYTGNRIQAAVAPGSSSVSGCTRPTGAQRLYTSGTVYSVQ